MTRTTRLAAITDGSLWFRAGAAALVVGVGLALRVYGLDRYSIWLDETIQYRSTAAPLRDLFVSLYPDEMFLSFILLKPLVLAGWDESAFALRLPIALLGTATIPVTWLLTRELFDAGSAWATAVLCAICPVLIVYSQEYRMYAFFVLLSAAGCGAFLAALRTNRTGWWAGFAMLALLDLYTHFLAAFNIASLAAFGALWWMAVALNDRRTGQHLSPGTVARLRSMMGAFALVAVGYLPAMPLVARFVANEPTGADSGALPLRFETLARLFGTYAGFGTGWRAGVLAALAVAGLCAAAFTKPRAALLAILWLGIPCAVFAFRGGNRFMLFGRYALFMVPVYLSLIGAGALAVSRVVAAAIASRAGPGRVGGLMRRSYEGAALTLAVASVLLLVGPLVPAIYARSQKTTPTDLRSAYEAVLRQVGPDDLLLRASSQAGGSVYYFSLYEAYFLRPAVRAQAFRNDIVDNLNFPSNVTRYLAVRGRLWVVLTVSRREERVVAAAFEAGGFETQCFPRICLTGAKAWQNVPMRTQLLRFFDAYAALRPKDYDVPRRALEAAK